MGDTTHISWAHHTFNPWEGCTKISPACDNCYAAERDDWLHRGANWGKDAERLRHKDAYWNKPAQWDAAARKAGERRRVFCGSLCDILEDRRDLDPVRGRLWETAEATTWIDWLFLTKRPQNARRLFPPGWVDHHPDNPIPPFLWFGTTVESDEYLWRIDALKTVPAAVHFLSIEPLLGPMHNLGEYLDGIDWVIVGGESGDNARPMNPEWVRTVIDACQRLRIPVHFKQWGQWEPCGPILEDAEFIGGRSIAAASGGTASLEHGLQTSRFVQIDGVVMEKMKKKREIAAIDGREWRDFPEVPCKP